MIYIAKKLPIFAFPADHKWWALPNTRINLISAGPISLDYTFNIKYLSTFFILVHLVS